jgi:hypothetical protein
VEEFDVKRSNAFPNDGYPACAAQKFRLASESTDTMGKPANQPGLPLLIEGQLLSQEQDFRAEGRARSEHETEEKKSICEQIGDYLKQRIQ